LGAWLNEDGRLGVGFATELGGGKKRKKKIHNVIDQWETKPSLQWV